MNDLYIGDCLGVLKKIVPKDSVDLIYLDPPFFTQKEHTLKTRDNKKEYSFRDTWGNISEYAKYIKERLFYCKVALKYSGSIFLHCDKSASHYLRMVLDEVFGMNNFQSEIIWTYRRWTNTRKGLVNSHQVIYFYSKSDVFKFNNIYTNYSPTTNVDQIFQERIRNFNGKSAYKRDLNGEAILMREKRGVPLSDTWEMPFLNPKAQERCGYPTQKPILLLERIIELVTDKGDIVLDPFCGSGTTLVAAKLLKRNYIGIDISEEAISLAKVRLNNPKKTESNLLKNGKESYLNKDEETLSILQQLDAVVVQRNRGIDGFIKINGLVRPIPIKIQKTRETLDEAKRLLINACKRNKYKYKILLKSNNSRLSDLFARQENMDIDLIVAENIKSLKSRLSSLE